jgi:nitrogen fixation NifU-like protein
LDNQGDEPQFDELYRDLILDHYRSPRNRGVIVEPDVDLIQHNPVCGDEIRLTAKIVDGRVSSIEFTGQGCSISQASASMLTDMVTGRDIEGITELADSFRNMLRGNEPNERLMEDLMALKGVSKYPVRVKCAVLAWDTLQKALEL